MKKYLITIIAILTLLVFVACASEPQNAPLIDDTISITDAPIAPDDGLVDLPEEPDVPEDAAEDIDPPATPPPHHGEVIEMGGGHSSWMIFDDMSHLVSIRDVTVFYGEVLDERPEWFDSFGSNIDDPPLGTTAEEIREWYHKIFTVYRVRVTSVFQGNMQPGDIVEVAQEGGERGGFRFHNREEIPIAVGDDMVFFASFSSSFPDLPGVFWNPYQTVYRFTDSAGSSPFARGDISVELESAYDSHHNIPITLGDLLELKVNNFGIEAALELDWVDGAELQMYLDAR